MCKAVSGVQEFAEPGFGVKGVVKGDLDDAYEAYEWTLFPTSLRVDVGTTTVSKVRFTYVYSCDAIHDY